MPTQPASTTFTCLTDFVVTGLPSDPNVLDALLIPKPRLHASSQGACGSDVAERHLRFALVGEGEHLGAWGQNVSSVVILTNHDASASSSSSSVAQRTLVFEEPLPLTLPFRLVLVEVVCAQPQLAASTPTGLPTDVLGGCSGGGGDRRLCTPVRLVNVDRRTSEPSVAPVAYTTQPASHCSLRATVRIDISDLVEDLAYWCENGQCRKDVLHRSLRCRIGTSTVGPFLALSMYGSCARRNFVDAAWRDGLDPSVARRVPGGAAGSMFRIVDVEFKRVSGINWLAHKGLGGAANGAGVVVTPVRKHRKRSTSPSPAGPPSLHSIGSRRDDPLSDQSANRECSQGQPLATPLDAIAEPLTEVAPLDVADAEALDSVRSSVTMRWWTMTLDLSKLTGWVPVFVLESVLLPDGEERKSGEDRPVETTRVPLMPDNIALHTAGTFSIPIWLEQETVVSALHLQYMEVSSFPHPANHYRSVRSQEGWSRLTLGTLVGHRGLGKTYTSSDASIMQQKLAENSLESFNAAHARGCECVELDVMMTKDFVPILFHDPVLQVDARGKQRRSSHNHHQRKEGHEHQHRRHDVGKHPRRASAAFTPYDALPISVHQLTYRQLNSAVTKAYQEAAPTLRLRELMIKHWLSILELAESIRHQSSGGSGSVTTPLVRLGSLATTPPLLANSLTAAGAATPQSARLGHSFVLRRIASQDDHNLQRKLSPPPQMHVSGGPAKGASPPCDSNHNNMPLSSRFAGASKHHRFITNHIPTLQELFDTTPPTLRVNLEIKFPFQPRADAHLFLQTNHFEINEFVDAILAVVFDHIQQQPTREIVFSSFEPDVCIALMIKQARFHVLFLSDTEETSDLKDYRSFEVETAIQFAHGHQLAGISMCALSLMSEADKQRIPPAADLKSWTRDIGHLVGPRVPSLSDMAALSCSEQYRRNHVDPRKWSTSRGSNIVGCCHRHQLKVWTWGDRNSDPHYALIQATEMQVDAIISDNVPLWSNASVGRLDTMRVGGAPAVSSLLPPKAAAAAPVQSGNDLFDLNHSDDGEVGSATATTTTTTTTGDDGGSFHGGGAAQNLAT